MRVGPTKKVICGHMIKVCITISMYYGTELKLLPVVSSNCLLSSEFEPFILSIVAQTATILGTLAGSRRLLFFYPFILLNQP